MVIATVASLAALALLFPGILGSRELARREACGENLRALGNALASFADRNAQRRLPDIEITAPLDFAGMYAVRLNQCGLIEKSSHRVCPTYRAELVTEPEIPSVEAILDLPNIRRGHIRRTAGGTYSFNLGYFIDGRYFPQPMHGRSENAILSDTPTFESGKLLRTPHLGNCLNVLFEDGHVKTIRIDEHWAPADDPFFNRRGKCEAGVDLQDSVLGPSHQPPLALPL